MSKLSRRIAAGLVVAAVASVAGCGGSGLKPHAQIRAAEVGTNLVNTTINSDTGLVLINGSATGEQLPYGSVSHYQFLQSGNSTFQASTTMPEPTFTYPIGTDNGNTTPVSVTVVPPVSTVDLVNGDVYTAYCVGRPDVVDPQTVPTPPGTTPPDLDPRYVKVVVMQDNQAAPAAGQATVRVLNAVCDVTDNTSKSVLATLPNINVTLTGAGNNVLFSNVPYATQAAVSSGDQAIVGGTVTVTVTATIGASTTPLTISPTTVTIPANGRYTLIITEPTDLTIPGSNPSLGPIPPVPAAQATTYGVQLITN